MICFGLERKRLMIRRSNIGIGNNYNVNNSLIEYTVGSGSVNIDVSYVDGFSVPIVCSCSGAVATGCNINL